MKVAALLLMSLSWNAQWLSGQPNEIHVHWVAAEHPANASLLWQLHYGPIVLAHGIAPMSDKGATVKITLPTLRARTPMTWRYKLQTKAGKLLEKGVRRIVVYPPDLLAPLAQRLGQTKVVVIDRGTQLSELFATHQVRVERLKSVDRLHFSRARLIVVAPNQPSLSLSDQRQLLELVKAGTKLVVFHQSAAASLFGYDLQRRLVPEDLLWHGHDPLLRGFQRSDLSSLLPVHHSTVRALRLPPMAPVTFVAAWPRTEPDYLASGRDTLLVRQPVGSGCMVLCQFPLGPWNKDPRSQRLLLNALDELAQPTPPLGPIDRFPYAPLRCPYFLSNSHPLP